MITVNINGVSVSFPATAKLNLPDYYPVGIEIDARSRAQYVEQLNSTRTYVLPDITRWPA